MRDILEESRLNFVDANNTYNDLLVNKNMIVDEINRLEKSLDKNKYKNIILHIVLFLVFNYGFYFTVGNLNIIFLIISSFITKSMSNIIYNCDPVKIEFLKMKLEEIEELQDKLYIHVNNLRDKYQNIKECVEEMGYDNFIFEEELDNELNILEEHNKTLSLIKK